MSALHDSGFDSWETKRSLGKQISTSDYTYLKGLSRKVTEKFPKAYDNIRLSDFANHNHTNLENLELKVTILEKKLEDMAIENSTLKRVIEYSIPKDSVLNAIKRIAEENGLSVSKNKEPNKETFSVMSSLNILGNQESEINSSTALIEQISKKKQSEKQEPKPQE